MGTIQDVWTGIKGITTGKSAYQQQVEANEALFNKLIPPPGTTIIQTTSGPRYVSGGSGGGGGGSGGGGVFGPSPEEQKRLEEQARQQELERQRQEQVRQKALADLQAQQKKKIQSGTISGQVTREKKDFSKGTISTQPKKVDVQVYTQPSIVQRQTGSVNLGAKGGYKEVPINQLFYINPYGESLSGGGFVSTERPATKEEQAYFKEQTSVLQASENKPSAIYRLTGGAVGSLGDIYRGAETRTREVFTGFLPEFSATEMTSTLEQSQNVSKAPSWMKLQPWEKKAVVFESGIVIGAYEDIRTKPLKNIALYGAGFGIGGAVSGISSGLGSIPKVGNVLGTTFKIGTIGAGVYLGGSYALNIAGRTISAQTLEEKGAIFGVGAKDILIGGFGYARGQKAFTQLKGWGGTRGRKELIVKQGEYPSAPVSKQLKMFKENVILELGETPGAFHTTSKKFWKSGIIEPKPGTSELPGLYASTQISTPFAKVTGSKSSYKLFPSMKDLLTLETYPGVAYLKPKGFRYSPFVYKGELTSFDILQGKMFKYEFVKPVKLSYADVPGMKGEIETIFRPEAGSYLFESGKYYTKISGVRVPIDVFGYGGKSVVTAPSIISAKGVYGIGRYSSYNLPSSYAILSPVSLGVTSYVSKISYAPSYSVLASSVSKPSKVSRTKLILSTKSSKKYSGVLGSSVLSSGVSDNYVYLNYGGGSSVGRSYKSNLPSRNFILAPPRIRLKSKSKSKRQIFKQPSMYQPSFTGSILGIKSRVPKDYEKYGFGALQVRGVPLFSRRKKKSTKKLRKKLKAFTSLKRSRSALKVF